MRGHVFEQFQEMSTTAYGFKNKISTMLFAVIKYLLMQL